MNKGRRLKSWWNGTLSLEHLASWWSEHTALSYPCKRTLLYKWHLWLLGIFSGHFQTGSLYSRGCSDHCGKIKMKGRNTEHLFVYLKEVGAQQKAEKETLSPMYEMLQCTFPYLHLAPSFSLQSAEQQGSACWYKRPGSHSSPSSTLEFPHTLLLRSLKHSWALISMVLWMDFLLQLENIWRIIKRKSSTEECTLLSTNTSVTASTSSQLQILVS